MKKSVGIFLGLFFGLTPLLADVSETIFIPKSDFTTGVIHFYHQGDYPEKYGFQFDDGFEKDQIVYAQPSGYVIETIQDGKMRLLFDKTDHYSYLHYAKSKDFIVSQEGNNIAFLISGGDCVGRADCVTKKNILTAIIPQGYRVVSYKGLDQNFKDLKTKEWKIKGEVYTLIASNVKGACLYMELEKNLPGESKKEAKVEMATPLMVVYQNTELFEKGDAKLSAQGKSKLKSLVGKMEKSAVLKMTLFQDHVAPKRLAAHYPTAEKFSEARADTLTQELTKLGLDKTRLDVSVVAKESERTRVEAVIPAR